MKKNFVKKTLASTLALAMVATATPAAFTNTASAAAAPKLNKSAKTLYINENEIGSTYDFNIKNKVSGSTYKWTTSNKNVVTVNAKNGKVAAGTVTGKATVSCKITLPTKKVKTLKATVTVKENATAVAISNVPTAEIGIGADAYDFNSTMTSASGAKATDYRVWEISTEGNTAGATIDAKSGKVTTTKAGEFKVRVRAYQNKAALAANDTRDSEWLTVKVVASIKDAAQTVSNKVKVTFDDNMKDKVKASDFVIKNKATGAVQQIKGISLSDDGKEVSIETHIAFVDGGTYTLTWAGKDVEFSTTIGNVATLQITPATANVNEATLVEVKAFNAQGVDITSEKGKDITISAVEIKNGWYDEASKKVTLFKAGEVAKMKAVYHTYTWAANGTENVVEAEAVITAVEKPVINYSSNKYAIADSTETSVDFDKVTDNGTICVGDTNKSLFVKLIGSDNKEIADAEYANYTVVSGNENVVLVNGSLSAKKVDIKAVAEGSTVVIIKDKDGKAIATLSITVKAKRVPTTIELDKTEVTATNVANKIAKKTIKVTVKDQYGVKSKTSNVDYTAETEPLNKSEKTVYPTITNNVDGTITVDAAGATAGRYAYKVSIDGGKKAVVYYVNVVKEVTDTNAQVAYRFEVDSNTTDTVVKSKEDANKKIAIKLVQTKNGVDNADYTTDAAVTYVVNKGSETTNLASTLLNANKEFVVNTDASGKVVKTAAGTYFISAVVDNKVVAKTAIVVSDTQPTMTFKANSLESAQTTASAIVLDTCEFYYNGKTYKNTDTTNSIVGVTVADDACTPYGTNKVFVKEATVTLKIDGVNVDFKVAINTTFTSKTAIN